MQYVQQPMREGSGGASGTPPVRVPTWAWPVITLCALLLGATAIVRGTSAVVHVWDSDLTNFFFPSAQYILHGDPFRIYAVNVGGYPDYNPPLSIFLMAPLLGLAEMLGFAKNYGEQITFVALPFILLVPVLGYLVLRALRRLYPAIPETQALLAYMLVVLSPLTWQTYGTWYHVEQPLMLCFLIGAALALQRRQAGLAGVLAALAVLSRTTALMPLLALGVLLLVAREWRTLVTFAGVGAVITLGALAPFFLGDFADTKYSLLTWRGGAPLGGNTIWALFSYGDTHGRLLTLISSAAKRLDMYVVVFFILVVAFLTARRLGVSAFERDAWAVMAIASLAVPMLSKTSWPYYFLEPFILLVVWEFSSMHDRRAGVWRWPVLSLGYLVVAATLSQYIGLHSVGYGDRVAVGLLESGSLFAFVWAIWMRARARKPAVPAPVLAGASVSPAALGPSAMAGGMGAGTFAAPAPTVRPTTERVPAPPVQPYQRMGTEASSESANRGSAWSPALPSASPSSQAPTPRQPLWPSDSTEQPRDGLRSRNAGWPEQPTSRNGWAGEPDTGTRPDR